MQHSGKDIWLNTCSAPVARIILAHGAGAPADHATLTALAGALANKGLEVIRFEFEYMAQRRAGGSKRPPPRIDKITVEWQQWLEVLNFETELPLFLAGKSMGGRAASILNNQQATPLWRGIICYGYPFHPVGQPEKLRTEHLSQQHTPIHIVQGTRDNFGNREEVATYNLPQSTAVTWVESGDHDLTPLKRSGISHAQALQIAAEASEDFVKATLQAT